MLLGNKAMQVVACDVQILPKHTNKTLTLSLPCSCPCTLVVGAAEAVVCDSTVLVSNGLVGVMLGAMKWTAPKSVGCVYPIETEDGNFDGLCRGV